MKNLFSALAAVILFYAAVCYSGTVFAAPSVQASGVTWDFCDADDDGDIDRADLAALARLFPINVARACQLLMMSGH